MENQRLREKTWFIVLMLFIFFPVGLFLMWRYANWNRIAKSIVTGVIILFIIMGYAGEDEKTSLQVSTQPKEETTNTGATDKEQQEKELAEKKTEEAAEARAEEEVNWEQKVKEVAASTKTETEKFDKVSLYAKDYKINDSELKEFETYIINEFKSGKYLSDIKNHEYMLQNIFKSEVIGNFYDDKDRKPMDEFAFDFWQNTKYTYRGVDDVNGHEVKANEDQMNKSLTKMNIQLPSEETFSEETTSTASLSNSSQASNKQSSSSSSSSTNTNTTPSTSDSTSYKNCSEVKAAGAAPIYQGEPGYSKKLDRDGDGIACDK
ncbi:excalibur calcium-binding domain-containing protein [Metabacillus fastidiosus]|uniref:excalibur calcium-binding domain-containing protein n=1 Tax=Metabacillus fastidiosus TaxID=1458 RepID=UPI003D2DF586